MSTIIFVIALWSAPGPHHDTAPALIPPAHALTVAEVAAHHGVEAVDVAGLLAAENRSRRYDPRTVGRHGSGGEEGLMQLVDAWKVEAVERCNATARAQHHRYRGLPDCAVIGPEARFEDVDLFDPRINLEVATIAVAYMQAVQAERHPLLEHWQTIYRCHPRAWRQRGRRISEACAWSTWRAVAWTHKIADQVDAVTSVVDHVEGASQRAGAAVRRIADSIVDVTAQAM